MGHVAGERCPMARGRKRKNTGAKVERSGYVYVLTNASMPGMVKIGFTSRSAGVRANELSGATGVPTPFRIVFQARARDALSLEKAVHKRLRSVRVKQNREFFRVTPKRARKEIVKVLKQQKRPVLLNCILSITFLSFGALVVWAILNHPTLLDLLERLYKQGVSTYLSGRLGF
jgi:hypothetical protein